MALFCSFVLPTSAITGGSISADDSVTLKDEKLVSTATLEDDFADDRVIVLLSNAASTSLRTYTTADFSEFGCSDVNNLTKYTTELVNAKLRGDNSVAQRAATTAGEQNAIVPQGFHDVNTSEFHQALCLTLEEKGKRYIKAGSTDSLPIVTNCTNNAGYMGSVTGWIGDTGNRNSISGCKVPGQGYTDPAVQIRVGTVNSGINYTNQNRSASGCSIPCLGELDFVNSPLFVKVRVVWLRCKGVDYIIRTGVKYIRVLDNGSDGVEDITMVSLRVTDEYGDGYSSSVFFAIDYARSKNIPILNISLGWILALDSDYDMALGSVISNYPGLVVCAAGNIKQGNVPLNIDVDYVYPASYSNSNIITVGASDSTDAKRFSSNYGATSVDLFAPGDNILSCYPVAKCQNGTHDTAGTVHYVNGYHYLSGTSMATPYVTGVAALILAKYPTLSPAQIKARILDSVDPISALSGYCVTGGRLNAYKALHNHSYTYTQSTALKHYGQCACGFSILEVHTWVSYGSGSRCSGCGYVIDAQINSVADEHLE